MASPKFYRDTKLDKVFDELSPIHTAMFIAGEFGRECVAGEKPLELTQLSHKRLLLLLTPCVRECQHPFLKQVAVALSNICREKLLQERQLSQDSSHSLDTSLKNSRAKLL